MRDRHRSGVGRPRPRVGTRGQRNLANGWLGGAAAADPAAHRGGDGQQVPAFGVFYGEPVPALAAACEGGGGDSAARAASAPASGAGRIRPRFPARRRMPAAARGLKKYLDRCGPVSKTSDKEHAAASLGDSEPLSVQYSPRHAVSEVIQVPQDGGEVASVVDAKEPGYVLAKEPYPRERPGLGNGGTMNTLKFARELARFEEHPDWLIHGGRRAGRRGHPARAS